MKNTDWLTIQQKVKIVSFIKRAQSEWLDVFIFEGLRSKDRQMQLFWYGRSIEELKKYGVPSSYAKPTERYRTRTLQSNHLTWNACDLTFDLNSDPKIEVSSRNWNYSKLINNCSYFGLRSLAPLESAHFENDWRSITQVFNDNTLLYKKWDIDMKTKMLKINKLLIDTKKELVK